MEQKFTRLDNGKIKWEYFKEEKDHTDKDFGKVGVYSGKDTIIFDSYEQAKSILDRDFSEVETMKEQYEKDLENNEHDLEKFSDLKDLVEAVGKLHNDFKEATGDKIYELYNNDPKRYKNVWSEFNKAKDYIKDEMSIINKEYQKYLNYKTAEKNLKFVTDQLEKITEQQLNLQTLENNNDKAS